MSIAKKTLVVAAALSLTACSIADGPNRYTVERVVLNPAAGSDREHDYAVKFIESQRVYLCTSVCSMLSPGDQVSALLYYGDRIGKLDLIPKENP